MPDTYAHLKSSIIYSTVWDLPSDQRIVWITMMAMKDKDGCVWSSVPGLAHAAKVPLEEVELALQAFLAPDPYSRTPDHDGRRIEAIDGGWRVLNHEKHRPDRDPERRRQQNREAKRRQRAASGQQCQPMSANVSPSVSVSVSNKTTPCPVSRKPDGMRDGKGTGSREGKPPCSICPSILDHLNGTVGRRYRLTGTTRTRIHRAHTKYGKNGEDACRSVINWLADAWMGTEGEKYLTVESIFRPTKFDARWAEIQAGTPPPRWGTGS